MKSRLVVMAGSPHGGSTVTGPAPPAMTPERPGAELTAEAGPWGCPVYRYRRAEIRCLEGGHVRALLMKGHPLDGHTFGAPGTITHLVDLWIREQRLPHYMRAVSKPSGA